eukprot:1161802-Pelagomonas_calceolata.AAC.19
MDFCCPSSGERYRMYCSERMLLEVAVRASMLPWCWSDCASSVLQQGHMDRVTHASTFATAANSDAALRLVIPERLRSHTHIHAHTHVHARADTHTHTHTRVLAHREKLTKIGRPLDLPPSTTGLEKALASTNGSIKPTLGRSLTARARDWSRSQVLQERMKQHAEAIARRG